MAAIDRCFSGPSAEPLPPTVTDLIDFAPAQDLPWLFQMATPKPQRHDPPDFSSPSSSTLSPTLRQQITDNSNNYPSTNGNPTYAAFSPATLSTTTSSANKRRSTILVHQKSPLLLATPPQITRALAYSHPFLLPLNKLAGLLSWTTDDQYESFLLVASFWGVVLYGDLLLRVAGPLIVVLALIGGMYGRRFSPLSSSGWSEPATTQRDSGGGGTSGSPEAKRHVSGQMNGAAASSSDLSTDGQPNGKPRGKPEATGTRHRKTLDEMVETLREFTSRCNILLEPLLELTDFLSTQRTPTSATTRPALTALLIRILLCTPFWFALTLPPLRVVTARRVVLVAGTLALTWHSRVCCVARTLLWRSRSVRKLAGLVTGLEFDGMVAANGAVVKGERGLIDVGAATSLAATDSAAATGRESELSKAIRRQSTKVNGKGLARDTGVRFTFIIYENQRRWVGLGWTSSLFTYERAAWTDERNNPVPPKDEFELPEVEDGSRMRWRWVPGSKWRVDGVTDDAVTTDDGQLDFDSDGGKMGWVYYDNKWQNGKRGQDSWGRWTRRRKWYRDAELVEIDSESVTPTSPITEAEKQEQQRTMSPPPPYAAEPKSTGGMWASLRPGSLRRRATDNSTASSAAAAASAAASGGGATTSSGGAGSRRGRRTSSAAASHLDEEREDVDASLGTSLGLEIQGAGMERDQWGVGDEIRMGLE
ncbi:hypothetical protein PoMZ_08804 [Pyricularia oryzae]|nr:hypothetical protein PoMZ_08804 [Pyricularia oryzae]